MALNTSTADVLDSVLASRPDVLEHLTAAHEAATAVVDARVLELCRLRIGMLLGAPPDTDVIDDAAVEAIPHWPTSPEFSDLERACLAFTEQFVIDVASMDDETANAVVDVLGGDDFANFVNALLVIEQRQRLGLLWDRLFDGTAS